MPVSKNAMARLPKGTRAEIDTIMREREGGLSFVELADRCWDWERWLRPGPFTTTEALQQRITDLRRQQAAQRPDWTSEQVDDYLRLAQLTGFLREIAIARRWALDDPAELGRMLAARNRLRRAAQVEHSPDLLEPCAVGDVAIAREIAARTTLGNRATVDEAELHTLALHALLADQRPAFEWLVEQCGRVKRKLRPWQAGIFTALRGVAAGNPAEVAHGLTEHIHGLHKMQQRDALDGAFKQDAHAMVRLFASLSPELVSQFDAQQDFPWDAPVHDWVTAHPDPVAGWNLSSAPPLVQQIVGRGELPPWLSPTATTELELVLLGGDPKSKPLLEMIEQLSGGNDGTTKRAAAMLGQCPVVLIWGLTEDVGRPALESARQRLESAGGQAEVRFQQPSGFRWFVPFA